MQVQSKLPMVSVQLALPSQGFGRSKHSFTSSMNQKAWPCLPLCTYIPLETHYSNCCHFLRIHGCKYRDSFLQCWCMWPLRGKESPQHTHSHLLQNALCVSNPMHIKWRTITAVMDNLVGLIFGSSKIFQWLPLLIITIRSPHHDS